MPAKTRKRPRLASDATSFDTVISFLSSQDRSLELAATVIERPSEMVIAIPRQPGATHPYNVRGRKVDHFYAGVDDLTDLEPTDVVARWALLGDIFVGIWIEDSTEYLISFRRPRLPRR